MKTIIVLGAAASALLAGPAAAQPGPDAGRTIDRAQVESRIGAMFARVDADRDGYITRAEADAARSAVRERRGERRGQHMAQRGERREALFARLDADRNGVISRDEFNAPRAAGGEGGARRFARGEHRGQRFAGRGMRGPRGGMGAGFGGEAFARMDADGDGRVSLAEATRSRIERFERVDANRDGRITRDEIEAVRAERQGR